MPLESQFKTALACSFVEALADFVSFLL